MKERILLLAIFLLCIGFMGCQKYPETQCPCGKIEISKKEYIAMCVVPNVVTDNSENKLIMENYTKENMIFCPTASLEYFDETTWMPITQIGIGGQEGTEIAVTVYAGKTEDFMFVFSHWIQKYNDSKKGKYRIVKRIDDYQLYAEFEFK